MWQDVVAPKATIPFQQVQVETVEKARACRWLCFGNSMRALPL
jgi:hypothetical protein